MGVSNCPIKDERPTEPGSKPESGDIKVEENRNSFQLKKNPTTHTATRPGVESGNMIRRSTPSCPHPSIKAASITSSGTESKTFLRIQIQIGRANAACTKASAGRLLIRFIVR